MKLLIVIGLITSLSSCSFYPKQIEYYDSDCDIKYKKLIMKQSNFGMRRGDCNNEACIAAIISIPIQAIVTGSIVIAGNTIFWLEKEGRCLLNDNN